MPQPDGQAMIVGAFIRIGLWGNNGEVTATVVTGYYY